MKLQAEWIPLAVSDNQASAYFCRPGMTASPLPGIVLVQEAFGVDAFIQDVAQRLATAGYAVLAPDLFSYGGKPHALAPARVEDAKNMLDRIPPAAWFDTAQRATALAELQAPRRT